MPTVAPPIPLAPQRIAEAAAVLAAAFEDDPLTHFIFPRPAGRRSVLASFFASELKFLLPISLAFVDGDDRIHGVAVFLPPGRRPGNPLRFMATHAGLLWRFPPRSIYRGLRAALTIQRVHIREPHWYLSTLGVEPCRQGQGVGTALIMPTLDRADREGLPVYLETSKEANLVYYRRFGFEVAGELTIPGGGPIIWTMLRPPVAEGETMEQTLHFEGFATPEDIRRSPYRYLPFQVPPRTSRVQVSYTYSEPVTAPFGMGPGNTVDIGIFDSRGTGFLEGNGFRGWGGSFKPEFFIAPEAATPGYIRGPIFPGEWNIMLGFERVQEQGVRYQVKVDLSLSEKVRPSSEEGLRTTAASSISRAPQKPKGRGRGRWLKGDLHCHTIHSDGLNSVEEIAQNAIERGLDFLAVTDHNTSTHHEDIERLSHLPIVLIPGEEVTTYWGHANMWGLREWIEFRCADEESMRAVQRFVLHKGGLISVNHPKCLGPPWLFEGWSGYSSMEVWQAPWRFYNWESLERWDNLLRQGERVVAVGGSDVHSIPPAPPQHPHGLGNPTTWVYAEEESEQGVLAAIRKGHVFISDDPSGSQLILTADNDGDGKHEKLMGDTVEAAEGRYIPFRARVIGGQGRRLWLIVDGRPIDIIPVDQADFVYGFSLELSGKSYIRAELRGFRGRPQRGEVIWAMTNPIWLKTKPDNG